MIQLIFKGAYSQPAPDSIITIRVKDIVKQMPEGDWVCTVDLVETPEEEYDVEEIDFSEFIGLVDLPEQKEVDYNKILADMQDWRNSR